MSLWMPKLRRRRKWASRGVWRYTHNSYIEVSSETGITGLVLFVLALFFAYRGLTPIRNRYPDIRVRRAALFTQVAVFMTAVGAFFPEHSLRRHHYASSCNFGNVSSCRGEQNQTSETAGGGKSSMTGVHASSRPPSMLGLITRSLVSPRSASRTIADCQDLGTHRAVWFRKVVPPSFASL